MPRRNPLLTAALARVEALAAHQGGVCTTAQARAAGVPADAVHRLLASGRWTSLHRGVHLTHRGVPDLGARMWAAHLALGPLGVVGGRTAARYWGLDEQDVPPDEPVTMVMPDGCRRRARGVTVTRLPSPMALAHPARIPPVLSIEHTVLTAVADAQTDGAAVDTIQRACRLRLTTPGRLLAAAALRPRLRRRTLLNQVCAEVRDGVTSELERSYRNQVARPHGLPPAKSQVPAEVARRRIYRDVLYEAYAVIVELDGRLGHEEESDVLRDQDRDNHATLTGRATLRFGWLAVAGGPCRVASQVDQMLHVRGWTGAIHPCGPSCEAVASPSAASAA
jgi:very-short-patch-repair endonuclease